MGEFFRGKSYYKLNILTVSSHKIVSSPPLISEELSGRDGSSEINT